MNELADEDMPNLFADKEIIIISSRVHPGESAASHILEGMTDLLLEYGNLQSEVLLDKFVFKIIPCLNPDGVS